MAYTTIDNPTDYFNTVLYTGNGTDNHSITGVGFQPDWVWIKPRNENRGNHLQDVIRGVNGALITNENSAEYTGLTTVIKSFDSDGFTLGTSNDVNKSSNTHVAWNWLAGGSASSNSNGSITSSVSANTTAGFSIVSYTGTGSNATVGHGLGVAPKWILAKSRDAAENWVIFHKSLNSSGAGTYIYLNTTAAAGGGGSNTSIFNNTAPTSSVFSIGTDGNINNSSDDYIAYCFAEKKGYSKFGSYVGNSDVNGPFVYTGFKPSFIIGKVSSDTNDWFMFDNKRSTFNPVDDSLFPNKNDAESTSHVIDFLSNGFKIRDSDGTVNSNGNTYIFIAFAESPFVTSGGVPTTAR